MLQARLTTTGSGTSAKPDPLRRLPGARRLAPDRVPGLSAPRPVRGTAVLRPAALRPVLGQQAVLRPVPDQSAGRLPMPAAARAGLAGCCPGGMLHKVGLPLTCKLASRPPMRRSAGGGAVPPSARGLSIRLRRRALRSRAWRNRNLRSRAVPSRARRATRIPPLTRRLLRCLPLPPGQNRAGRGQATAGHGPAVTGRGPMSTGREPTTTRPLPMTIRHSRTTTGDGLVAALPRRSRARHGRRQQRQVLRRDASAGRRPTPLHRGQ